MFNQDVPKGTDNDEPCSVCGEKTQFNYRGKPCCWYCYDSGKFDVMFDNFTSQPKVEAEVFMIETKQTFVPGANSLLLASAAGQVILNESVWVVTYKSWNFDDCDSFNVEVLGVRWTKHEAMHLAQNHVKAWCPSIVWDTMLKTGKVDIVGEVELHGFAFG